LPRLDTAGSGVGARLVSPVVAHIQPSKVGRRRARQVSPLRHVHRSSNAHRSNSMTLGIIARMPNSLSCRGRWKRN